MNVYFSHSENGFGEVFLEGAASYVYTGQLHAEAFAWLSTE